MLASPSMNLVTIADALAELEISRASLYRLLAANNLDTYSRAGDRRSYVDLDVLKPLRQQFEPRKRRPRDPGSTNS